MIAGLAGGPVNAEYDRQGWFVFAESRIEGFDLKARTGWNAQNSPPFVSVVECFGDNEDIQFTVGADGGIQHLHSEFLIGTDEKGNRLQGTRGGDVLWLYVDRKRYEYRFIPRPDSRFSNFGYAPFDPGEIILVLIGTPSVRQAESEPFRPLSSLFEQIVAAKKLEWSMKAATPGRERDPTFDPKRKYRIDNAGLQASIKWCRQQVASPAARTLPVDLLTKLSCSGAK